MTDTEYRTHFSLWCMLAAPLMAGNDLDKMSAETFTILNNKEVIAIDQDPLGRAAKRIKTEGDLQVWVRDLKDESKAAAIFNTGLTAKSIELKFYELNIAGVQGLRELWHHKDLGNFKTTFKSIIEPHGVVLLKITPGKK